MAITTYNDGICGSDVSSPSRHPAGVRSYYDNSTSLPSNVSPQLVQARIPFTNKRGIYVLTAAIILGSSNNAVGSCLVVNAENSRFGGKVSTIALDNSGNPNIQIVSFGATTDDGAGFTAVDISVLNHTGSPQNLAIEWFFLSNIAVDD